MCAKERVNERTHVRVVKYGENRRFSRTEHFSAYPVQFEPASCKHILSVRSLGNFGALDQNTLKKEYRAIRLKGNFNRKPVLKQKNINRHQVCEWFSSGLIQQQSERKKNESLKSCSRHQRKFLTKIFRCVVFFFSLHLSRVCSSGVEFVITNLFCSMLFGWLVYRVKRKEKSES